MKLPAVFASVALMTCVLQANAQSMKPGLWEITTQMQGGSGEMSSAMAQAQKRLESLPPEQRKMVQDMMAKQGVQMGASGGPGMNVRICMTQEMIGRNELGTSQSSNHTECTHTHSPRVGNTMKFSFVCTKPPSSSEGQVTFTSSEAYSMKMSTTGTMRGSPEKMEMQNTGRWLGADCGSVKPLMPPKKQ